MPWPLSRHSVVIILLHVLIKGALCEALGMSPVFLTVSSLYRESPHSSSLIDRELQIHWEQNIDRIALFEEEPTPESVPVLEFNTRIYPEGHMQTNISIGNPRFPGGWEKDSSEHPYPGDHCLPFWVGGYKANQLVHIECLKIHPTWMQDNRLAIGNLAVSSLVIPGTHNSGCYKRGESLSQRDTTGRYLLTQDQDLWSQLVYGIRYIDLRVGYYTIRKNGTEVQDSDSSFWVNHDLIKVRPLFPILHELKNFIEKSKEEIVILDLHRFPVGFSNRFTRHKRLVELLERELKHLAIPFTYPYPTLDTLWDREERLIISYGESTVVKGHDWLWPPISQLWGNQQSVDGLYNFLDSCMNKTNVQEMPKKLWAAMGHLTPAPLDILFNPNDSLRTLAHAVNHNLTSWAKNEWWNKANIVASDFFLENDLINVAIAANIKKGNQPKQYEIY